LSTTGQIRWVESAQNGIEVSIRVENISEKAVRAYTTRNWVVGMSENHKGCFLMNIIKPGKVLQPGDNELRTTWRSYFSESQEPVHLVVDFVEFTDNSTWGIDSCDSAQSLAGARAGARTVTEKLRRVLEERGPRALMSVLDSVAEECRPPNEQGATWQKGFLAGVQTIIDRVRQVSYESGITEVGDALKQPYDASGYEIQVNRVEPEPK
jgi:hypothetical protein